MTCSASVGDSTLNTIPRLILHFDVNKTLINCDSVTGKTTEEIIINQIAEDTIYRWDTDHSLMSYKAYVKQVIVPGDESNVLIKNKRREVISKFLATVKEYPEITQKVHEQYRLLKEKAVDSVFPSFIKLIDRLKVQRLCFTIILRTFGNDLEEVKKEILKKTGITFSKNGVFENGIFHLKGNESRSIMKTDELFKFFAASRGHIAIQDDYKYWNSKGEKARFGKRFVFEKGTLDRKVTHLSFFFDDNIRGDAIKDIVAPFTTDGTFVQTTELYGKFLFKVNTGQAILDEDYYIKLLNLGLRKGGFQQLSANG